LVVRSTETEQGKVHQDAFRLRKNPLTCATYTSDRTKQLWLADRVRRRQSLQGSDLENGQLFSVRSDQTGPGAPVDGHQFNESHLALGDGQRAGGKFSYEGDTRRSFGVHDCGRFDSKKVAISNALLRAPIRSPQRRRRHVCVHPPPTPRFGQGCLSIKPGADSKVTFAHPRRTYGGRWPQIYTRKSTPRMGNGAPLA